MASPIQWYPGHIAKAEKQLLEQLKLVDVVIEVRDSRILMSSKHPKIEKWVEGKSHILVCNRIDAITSNVKTQWMRWFSEQDRMAYFTDAQAGKGMVDLLKAAQVAGEKVNERRHGRGMLPRPVRAVVVGFPNVGKSALINRLLKKRVVASSNKAGVTRQLRWIRISDQIELLDTPGVIPPLLHDQDAAMKLAICDDIGQAAYDNVLVAAEAVDLLIKLNAKLSSRYVIDPATVTSGIEYIHEVAALNKFQGDLDKVARLILYDFRKGKLGAIALEMPPQ
ncbi:MAG: ribosome biogenesis GTPase YlqF [Pseudanabaena sp.]|jgi:ribosome biogenesis GTPase A|uniref:ribosome biogenesis GTPase YlqF n=1 Tax=Pseudanabaena sp. UWO311 TaxID=2487337 RepID=UPI00115C2883|nr:ribosome biogenesis GTPase YlqF [Pseudanabaena sp. UWO311]MCA6503376.1 ribosome biogenesis GTPase YlqF [Pseudanabaena sp. M090S1SP2A07QC]MCA6510055.1 ribosome biogenesis GTPase YlqF [Pseudanabaena sp. M109S1SP2A07QC]MCA6519192.1 ribosome biogenesis GTPase YlqF [Pseudanabaena sp. M110S1SP2A07QC]MCA6522097.1 ribosome biogenesis GTPase YlqF [Pseudanabaena sp. M051S1SP2A07QC]MCA6526904.1 ribosome biogenesis GTPase YlqF [Pseudanabaena sp. M179S2SP2A07QC]MCA6531196.1 ribosome biogenesis GTPase Y